MRDGLIINGKQYNRSELFVYCRQKITSSAAKQWEKEYCSFIMQWLDDSDTIQAQTSGSTGKPKQISLSKEKMLNSACLTGEFFGFEKGQAALLCLSTNYIAGKMMVVRAFQWQLNLIPVEPDGHPLRNLSKPVYFAAMLPLQVKNSLTELRQSYAIQNLLIGGGSIDTNLECELQNLQTQCYASYGMTETVSHVAIRKVNGVEKSFHFTGIGMVKFSQDERNCLCIHAPQLVGEGLLTNDIVDLKNEKEFVWLGRYDHVVNSGGIKLFPEQIEKKLQGFIPEAYFLAGLPDKHLGEKLVLLIEKKEGSEEDKDSILSQIKSLSNKYEQAREIYFLPEFKRTQTGKIQRKATLLLLKLSR